jgi:hypothetical protein
MRKPDTGNKMGNKGHTRTRTKPEQTITVKAIEPKGINSNATQITAQITN